MILRRELANPLLHPQDVSPSQRGFEVIGTFNAGVARYHDEVILLVRVAERPGGLGESWVGAPIWDERRGKIDVLRVNREDPDLQVEDERVFRYRGEFFLTSISHLRVARSRDGITFEVDPRPALWPNTEMESFGVEDARITQIGATYWITYKAVSSFGVTTALAKTTDFQSFTRHGTVFCPENLDVVLFPEKIGGEYVAWTRPVGRHMGALAIWLARSPDLLHWGRHRPVLSPREGLWDSSRVGASCVPLKTEAGWLVIYHGADETHRYCVGVALVDMEDPGCVLARSVEPLMEPETDYETKGFFGQVVFPCGAYVCHDDTLRIYYGASDETTCVATTTVQQLLDHLTSQ